MAVLYPQARLHLCYDSLTGLSVGDALGAQFFTVGPTLDALAAGTVPDGVWPWTDDTEMACNLVAELRDHGTVDRDRLARSFAERCEPYRGYGLGTVISLHAIRDGKMWRDVAAAAFDGEGSCGNGAAMRVAPLGAYNVGDLPRVVAEAVASAEVTHAHPEGIAGAVAVAVAAALAADARLAGRRPAAGPLLDAVVAHVPDSQVRKGLRRAARLVTRGVEEAAWELGNGSNVLAQDTVPFALWVAARRLDDYPGAIVDCVRGGGDIDTTGAITGGVVAAFGGVGSRPGVLGVPPQWLDHREPLPAWALRQPAPAQEP